MRENMKTVILRHLTADKLIPMVMTAVVGFLIATILGYGCRLIGAPLSNIAISPNGMVALKGKFTVQVQAVQRQTISHQFLFLGHIHYLTTFQIQIANLTVGAQQAAVLQISSKEGHLVTLTAPPLIKPRLADGTPAATWSQELDDGKLGQLGIDIEMPPQGVYVTLVVLVEKTGGYVSDRDLSIDMKCGNTLVQERAAAVRWANKTQ